MFSLSYTASRHGDPAIAAGLLIALMSIAALAAFVPVRRALKLDPTVALRYE
jgi:ABC-type antimicrobial peptide transport system permease subunit